MKWNILDNTIIEKKLRKGRRIFLHKIHLHIQKKELLSGFYWHGKTINEVSRQDFIKFGGYSI